MPIYEYRCAGCREKFETIVLSASANAPVECPKCGRDGGERLVSRFATASKSGADEFGDMGGGFDGGGDDDDGGDGGGPAGGDEGGSDGQGFGADEGGGFDAGGEDDD